MGIGQIAPSLLPLARGESHFAHYVTAAHAPLVVEPAGRFPLSRLSLFDGALKGAVAEDRLLILLKITLRKIS